MLARQPKPTDALSMAEVAHMPRQLFVAQSLRITVLQDTPLSNRKRGFAGSGLISGMVLQIIGETYAGRQRACARTP